MQIQTSAIVISSLKYGDNGLIVKCYTENSGIESFILKNAFSGKNKKSSIFTTLNQIKIIYDSKKNSSLNYLKESETEIYYQSIYSNPIKTTIVLFLGEMLNSVLKEEDSNLGLYNYLSNALIEFDLKTSAFADFHLWFLLNLTKFLGFYPNFSAKSEFFDLENGISTNDYSSGFVIDKDELIDFKNLIQMNFSELNTSQFNQIQRKKLLEILIRYYELHISDFRRPKSLEVLYSVFE